MYADSASAPVDPYTDSFNNAPPPPPSGASGGQADARPPSPRGAPRGRSRSRSPPARYRSPRGGSPPYRRRSPPPRRPNHAPLNKAPNPSHVLGVFGLSIRTQERDLEEEFSRFGRVEKVTIVYDQRSDRSRGFGFICMSSVEEATRCIQELNGIDLNGRRIRVDYSVTDRPHAPTPGEYMGLRRSSHRDSYRDSYRGGSYRDDHYRGGRSRHDDRHRNDDRRDDYGRDRDWRDRDRRSPRRYTPSPPPRRRRSYSRSPPRGSGSSPHRGGRDYDSGTNGDGPAPPRW